MAADRTDSVRHSVCCDKRNPSRREAGDACRMGALRALNSSRPLRAKSGHTRTAWRTGQIDPLLPSKIGPANGMEAKESGFRLKAWRCTRGGYSATAARLPLKAWQRSPRPVASGSSSCSALRPSHSTNRPRAAKAPRAVRVALLELEVVGRVEYLADRIALCASANET